MQEKHASLSKHFRISLYKYDIPDCNLQIKIEIQNKFVFFFKRRKKVQIGNNSNKVNIVSHSCSSTEQSDVNIIKWLVFYNFVCFY